ncbi:MAG: hypothetical protein R3C44_23370 [Chloroflexota bacterium]
MLGNRAIYHDGWMASCRQFGHLPWRLLGTAPFSEDVWELYIAEDFSQAVDLAEKEPEKLLDLRMRFIGEASKQGNVLPLDDRLSERSMDVTLRPKLFAGRDTTLSGHDPVTGGKRTQDGQH